MKQRMLSYEELHIFCGALAHLTGAGVSLGDAFLLLQEDEENPDMRRLLAQMAKQADSGMPLWEIVSQSGCFPGYVTTLLTVGMQTGKPVQTLELLSEYYLRRYQMQRQLRSVLIYPMALIGVLLAVIAVLFVWVLPVFADVYGQLGAQMTGAAEGLLLFGQLLRKVLPIVCLVIVAVGIVCVIPPVRRKAMAWWRHILGDRGVHSKILSARYVQALAMGLSSGMLTQEAMVLATRLTQGEAPDFEKRCNACLMDVNAGTVLPKALQRNGFLQPSHQRLLEAARRSGKMESVLQTLSAQLLEESGEALSRKASRIEPVIVAVACLLIGGVLITVMLPLVQLMSAIG